MIQEYFDVFWFIIAFGIGMFLAYVSTPHPEIIYKYPTPENSNTTVYMEKEGAISRFQKMIGLKKDDEVVITPHN